MHKEFDLDPNLIYLNSANQSILPRRVAQAIHRYQSSTRKTRRGIELVRGVSSGKSKPVLRVFSAPVWEIFFSGQM